MGKAIAYLIVAAIGLLILRSTGMFDGIFNRSNLKERTAFWEQSVAGEAPVGSPKTAVTTLASRHGLVLECFSTSFKDRTESCTADDPASHGGPASHPIALRLTFEFRAEKLEKFGTDNHILK